ncbi:hypothetical protein FE394_13495 [Xenorhabdus sp. Reich]|uniref:Uncharacterized protein n=2 Tax=Xenorhabdus littoralis TaxID=2582835 RepID=A0ABU4SNM8_9GAMM|nr:hypothetical protein [Xenorhabdus sp. Reich]
MFVIRGMSGRSFGALSNFMNFNISYTFDKETFSETNDALALREREVRLGLDLALFNELKSSDLLKLKDFDLNNINHPH